MRLTRAAVRVPALRIALAVLSVAVLASGCDPGSGGSGAAGGGQITVAVDPGIDNAALEVAVKNGLFQQQGLNVTFKNETSVTGELQALASQQAQIAVGDYTDFIYAQATNKAQLRLIADGYDAAPNSVAILTLPSSNITTPQDLETLDATVATPYAQVIPFSKTLAPPYSIETLAAQEVLQNDGVSPSGVNWKQYSPQAMIGELKSGKVQAILATEPYITEAEEQLGAVEVLDASTGVTSGLPLSGYFSTAVYAHQNPSVVQAFQAALYQAQADCAQRGPVQAVLPGLA